MYTIGAFVLIFLSLNTVWASVGHVVIETIEVSDFVLHQPALIHVTLKVPLPLDVVVFRAINESIRYVETDPGVEINIIKLHDVDRISVSLNIENVSESDLLGCHKIYMFEGSDMTYIVSLPHRQVKNLREIPLPAFIRKPLPLIRRVDRLIEDLEVEFALDYENTLTTGGAIYHLTFTYPTLSQIPLNNAKESKKVGILDYESLEGPRTKSDKGLHKSIVRLNESLTNYIDDFGHFCVGITIHPDRSLRQLRHLFFTSIFCFDVLPLYTGERKTFSYDIGAMRRHLSGSDSKLALTLSNPIDLHFRLHAYSPRNQTCWKEKDGQWRQLSELVSRKTAIRSDTIYRLPDGLDATGLYKCQAYVDGVETVSELFTVVKADQENKG